MKNFFRLVYLLCLAGHALAQPVAEPSGPNEGSTLREQRRADLRHALKAQRQAGRTHETIRQLTPEEREELRRQLRRQNQGAARSRP